MGRYSLTAEREDTEQVDSLRDTWQKLQARALASHVSLLNLQPQLENDLSESLNSFREDSTRYCHEYRYTGPMQPGLTPREASDKLILFQVRSSKYLIQ
jgi:dynein heavy chain, axonemal